MRKELGALFRQTGGTTLNGYVLRESLDPSRPLQFSAHDPHRKIRQDQLRKLGDVRRLGDLVDIRMGMHLIANKDRLGDEGVPVLSGRDVAVNDGRLASDRRVAQPDERHLLRAGDLCVASALGGPPAIASGSDSSKTRISRWSRLIPSWCSVPAASSTNRHASSWSTT